MEFYFDLKMDWNFTFLVSQMKYKQNVEFEKKGLGMSVSE